VIAAYNTIHVFTGARGGIGKSILLYCVYRYYLKLRHNIENFEVSVLDLNAANPDVFDWLSRGNSEPTHLISSNLIYKDPGFTYDKAMVGDFFCRQNRLDPVGSPLNYWEHITRIVQLNTGSVLLVDTNMRPNVLWPSGANEETDIEQKGIEELISSYPNRPRIYVWFLWTRRSLTDLLDAGKPFGKDLVDFDSRFQRFVRANKLQSYNFIHVFNPSSQLFVSNFNREAKWREIFDLIRNNPADETPQPVPGLYQIYHNLPSREGSPVIMDEFVRFIRGVYNGELAVEVKNEDEAQPQQMESLIQNYFLHLFNGFSNPSKYNNNRQFSTIYSGRCPENVLTIPNYYPKLLGFGDKIAINGSSDLEEADSLSEDMYQNAKKFLNNLLRKSV